MGRLDPLTLHPPPIRASNNDAATTTGSASSAIGGQTTKSPPTRATELRPLVESRLRPTPAIRPRHRIAPLQFPDRRTGRTHARSTASGSETPGSHPSPASDPPRGRHAAPAPAGKAPPHLPRTSRAHHIAHRSQLVRLSLAPKVRPFEIQPDGETPFRKWSLAITLRTAKQSLHTIRLAFTKVCFPH